MTITCVSCESCGMPLISPADCALGDTKQRYCIYCTNENGHLKSYDEVLHGMAAYLMHSQAIDHMAAEKMAHHVLSSMPAWQTKGDN